MSVEEIVRKCLTEQQPKTEEVLTFPGQKRLASCLRTHPVFGDTADYLKEKKVFDAVAMAFAKDKVESSDDEIRAKLRNAVVFGSSMEPSIPALNLTVMSLEAALKGCTQDQIPLLDRLIDRIRELLE